MSFAVMTPKKSSERNKMTFFYAMELSFSFTVQPFPSHLPVIIARHFTFICSKDFIFLHHMFVSVFLSADCLL